MHVCLVILRPLLLCVFSLLVNKNNSSVCFDYVDMPKSKDKEICENCLLYQSKGFVKLFLTKGLGS